MKYRASEWTAVRLRLEPKDIADTAPATRATAADYAQHVRALRAKLPPGFTVVVEPPFVVVGDEAPAEVQRRAQGTVRWAVERLKRDFFSSDPRTILDVWLLRDERSYKKTALEVFGDRPSTPYGYYSSAHGALVMNISTGGGTLVHEIVHPFVEADFPDAPPWLNEGLGSLFEQSADADGHIVGATNWRLAGLQRAIRQKGVPSFSTLLSADSTRFYDDDRGTNYAQARYLLYFLQQQGLLVRFYREFRAARATDPTGIETLRRVLGESDLGAFKTRWESWVAGLRYP